MAGRVSDAEQRRAELLVRLFDLRSFIGSLFVVFGLIVTIDGLVATDADIEKAAGLNISLWTGLAMLVVGVVFLAWMLASPPAVERREDGDEEPPPDQPDQPDQAAA